MTFLANFKDRRSLKTIGGCRSGCRSSSLAYYDTSYISRSYKCWVLACSCGKIVPVWLYPLHQLSSGLKAYCRQVWWSLRQWLKGPA